MITIAKGIASGMPLGILMTRAELMDWVPGSHASTFGGNPVAIAAALATIDVLEREAVKNSETIGRYMMERMKTWPSKLPLVGDVRGLGLMIGVELVNDKVKKTPAGEQRDHVVELAFEKGVLFLGCGPDAVRLSPPLIITKEQADIAMNVLEECIQDVASGKYVKPNWG
jgi:4-aminobutyrate aminotransferase